MNEVTKLIAFSQAVAFSVCCTPIPIIPNCYQLSLLGMMEIFSHIGHQAGKIFVGSETAQLIFQADMTFGVGGYFTGDIHPTITHAVLQKYLICL